MCLYFWSEQKEDKVSDSVTAKKRKLDKDESSDESSDEEERKTRIQLKHTNKTQKTGSYDLWSFDNNGVYAIEWLICTQNQL